MKDVREGTGGGTGVVLNSHRDADEVRSIGRGRDYSDGKGRERISMRVAVSGECVIRRDGHRGKCESNESTWSNLLIDSG